MRTVWLLGSNAATPNRVAPGPVPLTGYPSAAIAAHRVTASRCRYRRCHCRRPAHRQRRTSGQPGGHTPCCCRCGASLACHRPVPWGRSSLQPDWDRRDESASVGSRPGSGHRPRCRSSRRGRPPHMMRRLRLVSRTAPLPGIDDVVAAVAEGIAAGVGGTHRLQLRIRKARPALGAGRQVRRAGLGRALRRGVPLTFVSSRTHRRWTRLARHSKSAPSSRQTGSRRVKRARSLDTVSARRRPVQHPRPGPLPEARRGPGPTSTLQPVVAQRRCAPQLRGSKSAEEPSCGPRSLSTRMAALWPAAPITEPAGWQPALHE